MGQDDQTIAIEVSALSHAGEGIGRHEGRATFVPFALPGERVLAEIRPAKHKIARGLLRQVLTASPDRATPPCRYHFSLEATERLACGGCQLQHMVYEAQLRFKEQMVREQLTRLGGIAEPPVRGILPAPEPFHYRNHAQLALTEDGKPGFQAAGSNAVVTIQACPLLRQPLGELMAQIQLEPGLGIERLSLRAGADNDALMILEMRPAPEGSDAEDTPEVEITLPVSAAMLLPDGRTVTLAGADHIWEAVLGRTFRVSAGSFFQVNTRMAERLVETALAALALERSETALDLFSGVGLFSAFMAPLARRVIGVELSAPAVEDAVVNLDEFDNVEIYEAAAEEALPSLEAQADAALLDPPRSGCPPAALNALLAQQPKRIVYVSCDPATLARDVRRIAAGGYRLQWAQPLDMFPQTHHVETVALISRTDAG